MGRALLITSVFADEMVDARGYSALSSPVTIVNLWGGERTFTGGTVSPGQQMIWGLCILNLDKDI